MRAISVTLMLSVVIILAACNEQSRSPIEVDMYNPDGDSLGTATFSEQPDGVQIKLKLSGFESGLHGIHVHEYPKCEGPDFKTAGNHFNPESKLHGLMHPEGPHLGDMPNLEVAEDGKIDTEVMVQGATLKDDKNSLLVGEGTSLIIHEKQDDGITQPAGESGARIACGKITLNESNETESPSNPADDGPQKEE
ncbi:superoxide dismutase family protein [Salinibacillus xinjiangensis]|uniref:Superoxide dismutase family protein n=1 Tax=Salinibacillus xinjiangensis TaxID=1229268 RepID=A0A6G1X2Z2_9BACI|nr:superoxide dismutase family protein [Salinibacillus xinjiangensis]MRG85198.1 superoxide dismutase family protein [Salinibacillus xinjiangensis]